MKIEIDVPPILFQFTSLQQWVNHAKSRFAYHGLRDGEGICIDSAGRICTHGAQFMRADRDGTYPIKVYRKILPDDVPPAPAEAAVGSPGDYDESSDPLYYL